MSGNAIDPSLLFLQGQQLSGQAQLQPSNKGKGRADDSMDLTTGLQHENQNGDMNAMDQQAQGNSEQTALPASDAPIDLKDDATLAAFLARMDEYEPLLPDAVTKYYLEKAGFQCTDDKVTRLLGLAAQKFVSDIAGDAFAYARTRTTTGPGRAPAAGNASAQQGGNKYRDRTRTTLTLDDLAAAMREYGIDASRAPYYR